jgi:hypothetical protein
MTQRFPLIPPFIGILLTSLDFTCNPVHRTHNPTCCQILPKTFVGEFKGTFTILAIASLPEVECR